MPKKLLRCNTTVATNNLATKNMHVGKVGGKAVELFAELLLGGAQQGPYLLAPLRARIARGELIGDGLLNQVNHEGIDGGVQRGERALGARHRLARITAQRRGVSRSAPEQRYETDR